MKTWTSNVVRYVAEDYLVYFELFNMVQTEFGFFSPGFVFPSNMIIVIIVIRSDYTLAGNKRGTELPLKSWVLL